METITFQAPEYQEDGSFETHTFSFAGSQESGWLITRDDKKWMELPSGYVAVQSRYCGVCSTDLARKFLPYPLPQVIGHEVVVEKNNKFYVVEINASQRSRGIESDKNPYSHDSMHTQDPSRITLGINKLPGGFSPWVLAPVDSLVEIPNNLNAKVASLTEPFAAALQAVESTTPKNKERVAVLGPRRLGALVIAALAGYKKQHNLDFTIVALTRHENLITLCKELGADEGILLESHDIPKEYYQSFDVVYDTTGNPKGFESAVAMAKRAVHLKSTNGVEVAGLKHMTDLVVDELAILPYNIKNLDFTWPIENKPRKNPNIFVNKSIDKNIFEELEIHKDAHNYYCNTIENTCDLMFKESTNKGSLIKDTQVDPTQINTLYWPDFLQGSPFPRFDVAIASSLLQIDQIVRPIENVEVSLVRARGVILLTKDCPEKNFFTQAILERGLGFYTSRCGDFHRALEILECNPQISQAINDFMITHTRPLDEIQDAFDLAQDSTKSIKVIVDTCNM